MTETQKRIQAYKDALPGLKERVAAVALLLVMSFAMMTSASFAWLTISRRPEVTGVNTTVAANGNLEIALVGPNGEQPGESAVGDSMATKQEAEEDGEETGEEDRKKTVIEKANITWGNLVNLSDPVYGLENLTLRPAQLNLTSLLLSPLYGAEYSEDGRINQLTSNFSYTVWTPETPEKPAHFAVSNKYGVRAISSTKLEALGADTTYYNMVTAAESQNRTAANQYEALAKNNSYMSSLGTMMGKYMSGMMLGIDPTCDIKDISNLRDMYYSFLSSYDAQAQAIALMLNIQQFLVNTNYETEFTAEMVYSTSEAQLAAMGLRVTGLDQFNTDHATVLADAKKLNTLCESGESLAWSKTGLSTIVNHLVNVDECTLRGDKISEIASGGLASAFKYLTGTNNAVITNGILKNFEEMTGGYLQATNLKIPAQLEADSDPINLTAHSIKTDADRSTYYFLEDMKYTKKQNTGHFSGGDAVAQDTYGLAVDLWVRTNAAGSYLTLEGNVLKETRQVPAVGKDDQGNEVELYVVSTTVTDDSGATATYSKEVYKKNNKWYDAVSHMELDQQGLYGETPILKMVEEVTILGYEGVNRVWDESKLLSTDATTQGSGSCYVYYANPEDQARSLKLLEAYKVAFVDAEGNLMGRAHMDTANYYAANGRVVVPLVLDPTESISLGKDVNGEENYGLTLLQQNVATRITAIVYLDGTKLTNKEVLSAADIQGQLNIQFGSSETLVPIDNEQLENAERRVTASVDKTEFDYDTATEPMVANVTVRVDGEQPNNVDAFFLRSISETQGSREKTMTFDPAESGEWTYAHTFTAPGEYVLRTVRLDGVDYDLAEPIRIVVKGFAVESLSCSQASGNHVSVMSAAASQSVDLQLKFASNDLDKLPKTVTGRYEREDGTAVSVKFTLNPTTQIWSGTATFLLSGDYQMTYLMLDGEPTALPGPTYENGQQISSGLWQTAHVVLGMRVKAYSSSPTKFKYVPAELKENEKFLKMEIEIEDNAENAMMGMNNVKLTYRMKGSATAKMDANLTWNGKFYVGELVTSGAGIWEFDSVVVDNTNVLNHAIVAPTFTIMPPDPPEYAYHETGANQFAMSTTATMNVVITNSSAASVSAVIVNDTTNKEYVVEGERGANMNIDGKDANLWHFAVPEVDGYQDGYWTMQKLLVTDAYAADGSEYTDENPLTIDTKSKNIKTRVVEKLNIQFESDKSANFGKDGDTETGTFMQSYEISGLTLTISDFEGKAIEGIRNVKLAFKHNGDHYNYGKYTTNSGIDQVANFEIGFSVSDDATVQNPGTKFTQSAAATIRYAGSYTTNFSYEIPSALGDGSYQTVTVTEKAKLPVNSPTFTVTSMKPTAAISAAKTTNNTTYDFSATETEVKFGTYEKTGCNTSYTGYYQPLVTITLSNRGQATSASMQFSHEDGDPVLLYTSNGGTSATDRFEWTTGNDATRYVGQFTENGDQDDSKTAAGTLKAAQLVMKYDTGTTIGTIECSFSVPMITIKNPS